MAGIAVSVENFGARIIFVNFGVGHDPNAIALAHPGIPRFTPEFLILLKHLLSFEGKRRRERGSKERRREGKRGSSSETFQRINIREGRIASK